MNKLEKSNKASLTTLERLKNKWEGYKFINTDGEKATVLEYITAKNVKVIFDDSTEVSFRLTNLESGKFKNKNSPRYYGVGYLGYGNYSFIENKKYGDYWARMLERCYHSNSRKNPRYKECTVDQEWHNFQNFCSWMDSNFKSHMVGWQLDKDILIKNNKVYSKDTCCFVPQSINKLFTLRQSERGLYPLGVSFRNNKYIATVNKGDSGRYYGTYSTVAEAFNVYKKCKEEHIKKVAYEWKEKIDKKVFEALINYKVNITD